ncbi:MAG TPA: hypothetical protein VM598_02555, partial [Bdellovibrionota bacterium]|nr:hypothetical protein [Bdellovibrionota bacterium]
MKASNPQAKREARAKFLARPGFMRLRVSIEWMQAVRCPQCRENESLEPLDDRYVAQLGNFT